jgi:hypothetical protein
MADVVIEEAKKGKPIMGICLGMQLLFDKSYEYGEYEGLGLINGEVRYIGEVIDKDLKIPPVVQRYDARFSGRRFYVFTAVSLICRKMIKAAGHGTLAAQHYSSVFVDAALIRIQIELRIRFSEFLQH